MVRRSSISDKQIRQALKDCGGNKAVAARSLGMSRSTLRSRLGCMNVKIDIPPPKGKPATTQTKEKNRWIIESDRFGTPDEALEHFNVDTSIWEIERIVINGWDMTAKMGEHELRTVQNEQIKIWLRRKVSQVEENTINLLIERMKRHSPKYPKHRPMKKIVDPHMYEISVFDTHLGKLAWGKETGQNYDVKIAESLFVKAVSDLLMKSQGYPIEKILFPLGQDFFHVDGPKGMTFNDTSVDMDGRFPKLFATGCSACVNMIDLMMETAPVEILCVPGNHDRSSAWLLAHYLDGHYRLCDRVTVDISPKLRKYILYGQTLIGFTHGDEEKQANLPLIMAGEAADLWARAKHREMHTGHYHRRREMRYNAMDSHVGVVVRILPSLSGTDYWHYSKGFVNNQRAAEGYLWSKRDGYTGHFSSNVA